MDELDLFRDFNRSVAGPSEEARQRASTSLTTAIEGERRPASRELPRIRLPRAAIALTFAAVLGVVAIGALFVDSPWKSSPGFLERAQAALTPPEGMILHAKWVETRTSREYGCTFTPGPNELWADLSATYKYRLIMRNWPSPAAADRRSMACVGNMTTETGGTLEGSLRFVPPDTLTYFGPGFTGATWDAVSNLRETLAAGRAHHEGQTELDGRTVERIRIACLNPSGCSGPPDYWYVDPETFLPVQSEAPNSMHFFERFGALHFDVVTRYLTYEYLPRTAANLALTDIRAQHPDAKRR